MNSADAEENKTDYQISGGKRHLGSAPIRRAPPMVAFTRLGTRTGNNPWGCEIDTKAVLQSGERRPRWRSPSWWRKTDPTDTEARRGP